VAERLGLRRPPLLEEHDPEQRRGARGIDPEAVGAEALVRRAETPLCRGGVRLGQRDEAGEVLGLEDSLGDAELLDDAPR